MSASLLAVRQARFALPAHTQLLDLAQGRYREISPLHALVLELAEQACEYEELMLWVSDAARCTPASAAAAIEDCLHNGGLLRLDQLRPPERVPGEFQLPDTTQLALAAVPGEALISQYLPGLLAREAPPLADPLPAASLRDVLSRHIAQARSVSRTLAQGQWLRQTSSEAYGLGLAVCQIDAPEIQLPGPVWSDPRGLDHTAIAVHCLSPQAALPALPEPWQGALGALLAVLYPNALVLYLPGRCTPPAAPQQRAVLHQLALGLLRQAPLHRQWAAAPLQQRLLQQHLHMLTNSPVDRLQDGLMRQHLEQQADLHHWQHLYGLVQTESPVPAMTQSAILSLQQDCAALAEALSP